MLPMSSLSPAMSAIPGGAQMAAPQPAGGMVSFASTGIPGLTGGYAYPPGSEMSNFLDGLNGTVAAATRGPDGSSVIAWAQALAQQAALRQQQAAQAAAQRAQEAAAAQAQAATSGGTDLIQMLQTLLSMLTSQLAAKEAA